MIEGTKTPFKSNPKPPSFEKRPSKKRTMDEAFPERLNEEEEPSINTVSKRDHLRKEVDMRETLWEEIYASFGLASKAKKKSEAGEKLDLMQELKNAVR